MSDRITTPYLFVYGTLQRQRGGGLHPLLKPFAEFVGEAQCQGKLYRVNPHYPGLVRSADRRDTVRGEVYRLRGSAIALARLDDHEGCSPRHEPPTEYRREIEPVTLQSGQIIRAWVYIYNWPTDNLEEIASGDFRAGDTGFGPLRQ